MSFATLERAMLNEARIVFNNPKLRKLDIMEWSTSEEQVKKNITKDEVMAKIQLLDAFVCIDKKNDKRKPS